jgi:hypothetical protein
MNLLDDDERVFSLTVTPVGGAAVNLWPYVKKGSISVVDAEGAEVDTLSVALENYDGTLSPVVWSTITLAATDAIYGATTLFAGYITKCKPTLAKGESYLIWELGCESSATLLNNSSSGVGCSNSITGTWIAATAKTIIGDCFTRVGLTDWDASTYVDTGPTFDSFTCQGEHR